MATEFNLIDQYFTRPTSHTDLGIGDDAAIIQASTGHQLTISTDMSVAGTHFLHHAAPYNIGWKSLAVNVSDLAAMGATPKWTTLAIALPEIDKTWLAEFSRGFFACADVFNIDLIGGDTTRGPLNIAVQIMGEVPIQKALKRSGAQTGDDIWVSGQLGNAALALSHLINQTTLPKNSELYLNALNIPQPRINLGLALRDIAHSCIDVSDGLLADLSHILTASNLGADVDLKQCPTSDYILAHLHEPVMQQYVLAGGDDYELCFTAPNKNYKAITDISKTLNLPVSKIGQTTSVHGLRVTGLDDKIMSLNELGYEHFSKPNRIQA